MGGPVQEAIIRPAVGVLLYTGNGMAWSVMMDAAVHPSALGAAFHVARNILSLKLTTAGVMWIVPTTLN